jgi:D-3-phosphoglycerate dehydrogenase
MKPKVVISQAVPPEAHNLLADRFDVVLPDALGQEPFERAALDADAIVLRTNVTITRAFLEKARKLKIISRTGAGADNVDYDACVEKNVLVCTLPGINNVSVAEHAVGMMAALAKYFPLMDRSIREPEGWAVRRSNLPAELREKTVGIVGMGSIGSLVADICYHGFHMQVLAYDPFLQPEKYPLYRFTSDLQDLFASSDFITLHLPSLPSTRHVVMKDLLRVMQPHAFLINCARGDIVDSAALYESLQSRQIAGAGLDVFEEEPPKCDDRLLALPNVLATPHCAGLTKEAALRMSTEACRQIVAYFETGKPLWVYQPPKTT